jgi:hypothetical protein
MRKFFSTLLLIGISSYTTQAEIGLPLRDPMGLLHTATPLAIQAKQWTIHYNGIAGPMSYESGFGVGYGFNDYLNIYLSATGVRGSLLDSKANFPQSAQTTIKIGPWVTLNGIADFAFIASARSSFSKNQNLPGAFYDGGHFQFTLIGVGTYFDDPAYVPGSMSITLNAGVVLHNDGGLQVIADTTIIPSGQIKKTTDAATEFVYSLAVRYPFAYMALQFELWGSSYTTPPEKYIYGREGYLYLTPSFRYLFAMGLDLTLGLDFRISSANELTAYASYPGLPVPAKGNYDALRVNLNLMYPLGYKRAKPALDPAKDRKAIEALLKKAENANEAADEELKKVKEKRKDAEKKAEDLEKKLTGEQPKP